MQCAGAILSSVTYLALQCFSTLSHINGMIFEKELLNTKYHMCFIFSITSV